MEQPFDLVAGTRKPPRKPAPVWLFLALAVLLSALATYIWTYLIPPPRLFFWAVQVGGPSWAIPYVLVEGTIIGLVACVVVYFAFLMGRMSFSSRAVLLAATVLPALAVSGLARKHDLDVLLYRPMAQRAAERYHAARDGLTEGSTAHLAKLGIPLLYGSVKVTPAELEAYRADLVQARATLAAFRARASEPRIHLQLDIRGLPMPKGERDRLQAVAAPPSDPAECAAFWAIQEQELDLAAAMIDDMGRAAQGNPDEADFARRQTELFALVKSSRYHHRRLEKAEEAREAALVAAVR